MRIWHSLAVAVGLLLPVACGGLLRLHQNELLMSEQRDPAGLAMRPPKLRIDASFGIDRCDEDICHFVVAIGMTRLAGQHDAHLPELARQVSIQDGLAVRLRHVGHAPWIVRWG